VGRRAGRASARWRRPTDFNDEEMLKRSALLEADGFDRVHFFTDPDMGHRMTTPQRFAEALRWVDEPCRQARDKRSARAASLLAAYLDGRDDPHARSDEDRTPLRLVIETAPFSDAAWRALAFSRNPAN
jgi:hypothetical protein